MLRYYAHGALESEIDFKKMQFGLSGNLNAAIVLAEGKFFSRAYWPNEAGYQMKFDLTDKQGVKKSFDFGSIRAYLELNATAFVGASAVGSICVEFNKAKTKDKLAFRGVNKAGKGLKPDKNTATGKLFAGAEAGGEVVGKCEWDNPEKRTDPSSPAWCEFVSIGYGLKGAAGIGAELEFNISYDEGRFMFRARARLVLGLGAGGSVVGAVDAGTIGQFIQFIYHQLKNHGYHFLDAISRDAFNRITRLQVWAAETGEAIEDFGRGVAQGISDTIEESVASIAKNLEAIGEWWRFRKISKRQAELLALNILADPDKLKFTTPEAKGILLHTLCKTFFTSFEEDQEKAIIKILEHVQSQREYKKVCEHITKDGSKIDFYTGRRYLSDILDGKQLGEWGDLRRGWEEKRRKWKRQNIKWENHWKVVYSEHTKKDSPVETINLV